MGPKKLKSFSNVMFLPKKSKPETIIYIITYVCLNQKYGILSVPI